MASGRPRRTLSAHQDGIGTLAFSPDGWLIFGGGSYGTTNAWEAATGRHLVTLFAFSESRGGETRDDWLAHHPDGFYHGSPGADRYLAWRLGDDLRTADSLGPRLRRPDRVASALRLAGTRPPRR